MSICSQQTLFAKKRFGIGKDSRATHRTLDNMMIEMGHLRYPHGRDICIGLGIRAGYFTALLAATDLRLVQATS